MRKSYGEGGNVGQTSEDVQRHQRVLCKPLLAIDEKQGAERPENDQANHCRRAPRKCLSSKIESEKQHQGQAQDGQAAEPIDSPYAFCHLGLWVVYIQEEEKKKEGNARHWQVDPVCPSPGDVLRESTAK